MMRPAFILIGLWAASTAGAFWFFTGRYFIPAQRPAGAATIDASTHPKALTISAVDFKGKITVLDFWDPECPCSRFMEATVDALYAKHGKEVQFVRIASSRADNAAQVTARSLGRPGAMRTIADDGALARQYGVWAAPAAVIINPEGKIAYVGAYNVSRYCVNEDTAFASRALEALLVGKQPPRANLPFYGCQVPPQPGKSR